MQYTKDHLKLGVIIIVIIAPLMLAVNKCKGQNKTPFYLKLAPSYLFHKDADNTPAFFAGGGLKIDRYLKCGIGAGYFKFKGDNTPFLPLGIDLNFCDFGKKNPIFPIVHFQAYYPFYNKENSTGSNIGSTSINTTTSTKGNFMYQIGGGIAISINESSKFFITAHYSGLTVKNKITTRTTVSGSSPKISTTDDNASINITGITIGFIL